VHIVRAECGDDAGLLGAAQIAFTRPGATFTVDVLAN
jgi:hypothetical protein